MMRKTLAVAAAIALAGVAAAAPASAAPAPGGCEIHFETILGGVCVPTP